MEDERSLEKFLKITPFICALMVVGIHSYNAGTLNQLSLVARIEGSLSHGLFTAAVPIFFFLSGYLFYRNTERQKDVIEKQKRRIKSIVIPFLVWSTFYYLFYAIITRIIPGITTTTVDISLRGALKGIIFYEYVFPMWFVFQLIMFIILAPLVFAVLKNKKISIFLLLVVVVFGVLGVEFKITIDSNERVIFAANYFSYYFCGCLAAKNKQVFYLAVNRLSQINTYLLWGMLGVSSVVGGLFYDVLPIFNKRLFVPIVAILSFILIAKQSENIKVGGKKNQLYLRSPQWLFMDYIHLQAL